MAGRPCTQGLPDRGFFLPEFLWPEFRWPCLLWHATIIPNGGFSTAPHSSRIAPNTPSRDD
ncbi:hypothetical protein DVJ77_00435 [Dyella tabacisoli]|uniref:Uncharacterized protein n=1 Tax=Dyella tabacisoli TaxID=2282381 RepID=A0A369US32_9GAMM|nr:hypothetical protein DVJ77_00435 [Dyella tabacisoli]